MSLAPDEIEVTRFALDDDSAVTLDDARECLNEQELERASRFKFRILRERYIRGRGMVRFELARHLSGDPAVLQFGVGEHGKPFLVDGALHFNLSHSEGVAALAVSCIPAVGIDIEKFDRKVDFDGLAKRCFRDSEWSQFSELPQADKVRAFFWAWTAKEARMKATGEGFQLAPKMIELLFEGGLPRKCIEPVEPGSHIEAVEFSGGDTACVIAALSPFRLRILDRFDPS